MAGWVPGLLATWRVFVTFHLVVIAWVFFRADSLRSAVVVLDKTLVEWLRFFGALVRDVMHLPFAHDGIAVLAANHKLLPNEVELIWNPMTQALLAAIVIMEAIDELGEHTAAARWLRQASPALRWSGYVVLVVAIAVLAPFGSNQFIHFQF